MRRGGRFRALDSFLLGCHFLPALRASLEARLNTASFLKVTVHDTLNCHVGND